MGPGDSRLHHPHSTHSGHIDGLDCAVRGRREGKLAERLHGGFIATQKRRGLVVCADIIALCLCVISFLVNRRVSAPLHYLQIAGRLCCTVRGRLLWSYVRLGSATVRRTAAVTVRLLADERLQLANKLCSCRLAQHLRVDFSSRRSITVAGRVLTAVNNDYLDRAAGYMFFLR